MVLTLKIALSKSVIFKVHLSKDEVNQLIGSFFQSTPITQKMPDGLFQLTFLPGEAFFKLDKDIEDHIDFTELIHGTISKLEISDIIRRIVIDSCPVIKINDALVYIFENSFSAREVRFELENVYRDQASHFGAITSRDC